MLRRPRTGGFPARKKTAKSKLSEAVAALVHSRSTNTSRSAKACPSPKNHRRPRALDAAPAWHQSLLGGQASVLSMDRTDIGSKHAIHMIAHRVEDG